MYTLTTECVCNQLVLKVNENMHEHAHSLFAQSLHALRQIISFGMCVQNVNGNCKAKGAELWNDMKGISLCFESEFLKRICNWSAMIKGRNEYCLCKMITFECGTVSFTSTPISMVSFHIFFCFSSVHLHACTILISLLHFVLCITHTLQMWVREALKRPHHFGSIDSSICKYNFHKRNRIRFR